MSSAGCAAVSLPSDAACLKPLPMASCVQTTVLSTGRPATYGCGRLCAEPASSGLVPPAPSRGGCRRMIGDATALSWVSTGPRKAVQDATSRSRSGLSLRGSGGREGQGTRLPRLWPRLPCPPSRTPGAGHSRARCSTPKEGWRGSPAFKRGEERRRGVYHL